MLALRRRRTGRRAATSTASAAAISRSARRPPRRWRRPAGGRPQSRRRLHLAGRRRSGRRTSSARSSPRRQAAGAGQPRAAGQSRRCGWTTSTGSPTRSASSSSPARPNRRSTPATASTTWPGSRSSRPTCSRRRRRPAGALAERWVRQSVRFLTAAYDPGAARHAQPMLSYSGTWLDDPHHGDHVGRAMWALGVLAANAGRARRTPGGSAARCSTSWRRTGEPVRACGCATAAYTLLGLARARHPPHEIAPLVRRLDERPGPDLRRSARLALVRAGADLRQRPAGAGDARRCGPARRPRARRPRARGAGLVRRARRPDRRHAALRRQPLAPPRATTRRPGGEDGDEQPIDAAATVEALVEAWTHTGTIPVRSDWPAGRTPGSSGATGSARACTCEATGGCHDGCRPTRTTRTRVPSRRSRTTRRSSACSSPAWRHCRSGVAAGRRPCRHRSPVRPGRGTTTGQATRRPRPPRRHGAAPRRCRSVRGRRHQTGTASAPTEGQPDAR